MHEDRLKKLIEMDKTDPGDLERHSLLYIISGNLELYSIAESIYDFEERSIKPEILESGICTSSKALIKIAFALCDGHPAEILDCFSPLDDKNFEIAMEAIRIRLGK